MNGQVLGCNHTISPSLTRFANRGNQIVVEGNQACVSEMLAHLTDEFVRGSPMDQREPLGFTALSKSMKPAAVIFERQEFSWRMHSWSVICTPASSRLRALRD